MIAPRSEAEAAAFELWKRLQPDDAFVAGIEECAGQYFVPSRDNVARALKDLDRITRSTKDATVRKFLASLRARLTLPEPNQVPEAMVISFFGYMVKEGVRPEHIGPLAEAGARAIDAERRRYARRKFPPGMRALVQLSSSGLAQILDVVETELKDPDARRSVGRLHEAIAAYRKAFELKGFRLDGTFEETYAFFKEHGADLGRSRHYARALRDLWDYTETPAQVEAAGMRMLNQELPHFRNLVGGMAMRLGCNPSAEAIAARLKEVRGVQPPQILEFLNKVRGPAQRFANKHVVGITPAYDTLVLETPPYLANTTPSGAAYSVNSLTDHSKEIFMATTDPRSAERPPPGELLNLLIHEEYGHCVHGSNASHAFAGTPSILGVLNSPSSCVSEGLAFQRELEFVPFLRTLAAGNLRGPEEDAFVESLVDWGGVDAVATEYEYLTYLWRIVRFLRVIGDARINSGQQDIVEFVDWAHEATGLEKATVYYQVFPAHQVLGPGYASTYAIIGERIRAIQDDAVAKGIPLREFNAFAASIGWPPKSVYEAALKAWVRERTG